MRNLRSIGFSFVVLPLALMGLAACGGADGDTGSGDSGDVTIGYSTYTLSNPFFAGMMKGFENGAKEKGYELLTTNANGDPAQQVTDIQNLISRGVDYIILTPADGKAIAPAIEAAKAADIPVISVPDRVEPEISTTIAYDEIETGTRAGEYVTEAVTAKNGEPVGKIVQIEGISGIPSAIARKTGFEKVIAESPGLEIVASQDGGYDTDQSFKLMVDILQANQDIDAVWATNDAEAIGVTAALKSQDRFFPVGHPKHIILLGADGSEPAIKDIRDGVQDATLSLQPIAAAEQAVDVVAQIEAGEDPETEIILHTQLISTENIDSPEVLDFGIWADEL